MTTINLDSSVKCIGILSDTHGYIDPRIPVALEGVDVLLHAGDIMSNDVLDELKTIADQIYCVAGNNDIESVWPKQHKDIVNAIPEALVINIGEQKISVVHGHQYGMQQPDHRKLREVFADSRIVIYGHTHQLVVDNDQHPWVINPGAAGKIRTKGGVSCLRLNLEYDTWKIQTIKFLDQKRAA